VEDHEQRADELQQEAQRVGEQSDRVQDDIDDARSDFEGKLGDPQAPGLLEEEAAAPGGKGVENEDDERVDEDERENVDAEPGGPA
jgi:hypothetical protein